MKIVYLISAILCFASPLFAMQEISIKNINGINYPDTPIPRNAKKVICNGSKYIVYEQGDVLPADPVPPQPKGEFLGKKIYFGKDVKRAVAEEIANVFAAPTDSGDKVADQLKLVCDILALLCAKEGWVSYPLAGIQGVTSEAQAIIYITDNLVPLLNQRNSLRQQAKQFILDNGL